MGLPQLNVYFKTAADTAVKRSGNGICALILKDDTASEAIATGTTLYTSLASVKEENYTADNYNYIKMAFLGSPGGVLVMVIGAADEVKAALAKLKTMKWNYLAVPVLAEGEAETIADWIKAQRASKKTFKAVLPDLAAEHEGIVNFATDEIVVNDSDKVYTTAEYCVRIAGFLAGLSIDQFDKSSATYAVLTEVKSVRESDDPDADIDAGKLILINDGSVVKIGRAVNSLVKLENGKTEDMRKIRIIETMDLITDDIREAFEANYIGQINKYDNKLLFVNAVNQYYKELENIGLLDDEYENTAYISVELTRKHLASKTDVSSLTDDQIKKQKTGSHVFIGSAIQINDAMEDLTMEIGI